MPKRPDPSAIERKMQNSIARSVARQVEMERTEAGDPLAAFSRYIPITPTQAQRDFLALECLEALYGGAAGGGKSTAALAAALQYVDRPGYAALIVRRKLTDLQLPGALMEKAREWLTGTDARYNAETRTWTFPSNASLTFGYLDSEEDKYRYQSSEFQYIGVDELTQFTESQYLYLFSRLRRTKILEQAGIPLRMRSGTNPGGKGHTWVYRRFVKPDTAVAPYVRAVLDDNPHADRTAYEESLGKLDSVTRKQLRDGNWLVRADGMFKSDWLKLVTPKDCPPFDHVVRFWDFASSKPKRSNPDPDYTAGVKMGYAKGQYWILDVRRIRDTPKAVEDLVHQTAFLDGRDVPVWIEQEPGSSGAISIDHYARVVLPGWEVRAYRPTVSKAARAGIVASAAEHGNLFIVDTNWTNDLIDELCAFPEGHDDQVDGCSGAAQVLTAGRPWQVSEFHV